MADTIAKIMIVLGPVFVLIGTFVFLYIHRDQWRADMKALSEPDCERFTITFTHEEPTPEALKNRAAELGITPEELIKKFIEKALTIDAREANSG